jgi:hypothetical protein
MASSIGLNKFSNEKKKTNRVRRERGRKHEEKIRREKRKKKE